MHLKEFSHLTDMVEQESYLFQMQTRITSIRAVQAEVLDIKIFAEDHNLSNLLEILFEAALYCEGVLELTNGLDYYFDAPDELPSCDGLLSRFNWFKVQL